jgi:fructose-specific phosphotransferase system IIC component
MPIDLSTVNWSYVALLSGFAFIAALLGSVIAFRSRFLGAIIAGFLFAAAFVFWTYYPHENLPWPLSAVPTSAR